MCVTFPKNDLVIGLVLVVAHTVEMGCLSLLLAGNIEEDVPLFTSLSSYHVLKQYQYNIQDIAKKSPIVK